MDTEVLGWEMATAVSGYLVLERSASFESLVPYTLQKAPTSVVSLGRKAYEEVLRLTHLGLGTIVPRHPRPLLTSCLCLSFLEVYPDLRAMEPGCIQSSVLREEGAMRKDLVSFLKSPTVVITPLPLTGITVLGHNPQHEYL